MGVESYRVKPPRSICLFSSIVVNITTVDKQLMDDKTDPDDHCLKEMLQPPPAPCSSLKLSRLIPKQPRMLLPMFLRPSTTYFFRDSFNQSILGLRYAILSLTNLMSWLLAPSRFFSTFWYSSQASSIFLSSSQHLARFILPFRWFSSQKQPHAYLPQHFLTVFLCIGIVFLLDKTDGNIGEQGGPHALVLCVFKTLLILDNGLCEFALPEKLIPLVFLQGRFLWVIFRVFLDLGVREVLLVYFQLLDLGLRVGLLFAGLAPLAGLLLLRLEVGAGCLWDLIALFTDCCLSRKGFRLLELHLLGCCGGLDLRWLLL